MDDAGYDRADLDRDQRSQHYERNRGDASALAAILVATRRPTHDRPPWDW
jgi:hypothetical protein